MTRLEVADLVAIACELLGADPAAVLDEFDLDAAESVLDRAQGSNSQARCTHENAAALLVELITTEVLPRSNQRLALLATLQLLNLNGLDVDLTGVAAGEQMLSAIRAGTAGRPEAAIWLEAHLTAKEPLWERVSRDFTPAATQALTLARDEAALLAHSAVGTEHLLLGLLHDENGVAGSALHSAGLQLHKVRKELKAIAGQPDDSPTGPLGLTRAADEALELALRVALDLGQGKIDAVHLLLGILRAVEGGAARVLATLGVDPVEIHRQIMAGLVRRPTAPAPSVVAAGPTGRVTTVCSFAGGSGASVVTTNLAALLAQRSARPVAVVDGDVEFGDVALMLGLAAEHNLLDAVSAIDHLDGQMLRDLLARDERTGVLVLASARQVAWDSPVRDQHVIKIIRILRTFCDHVIVNTASRFDDVLLGSLAESDTILVIAGMDVPNIGKRTRIGFQTLRLLGIPSTKVRVILNQAGAEVGTETEDIERTLHLRSALSLPIDPAVPRSVTNGTPAVVDAPDSPFVRALARLADVLASLPTSEMPGDPAMSMLESKRPAPGHLGSGHVFERFTDRARRVLVLAQEDARLLNHNFIGTEHILLGLLHEGDGVLAKALGSLGISLEAVREKLATIGPAGSSSTGSPPFTPRAKKVLQLSLREALHLGYNYIGTEHIFLSLVHEGEGVAAQVLVNLGADLSRVRREVIQLLADSRGTGGQPEAAATVVPRGALVEPGPGVSANPRPIDPTALVTSDDVECLLRESAGVGKATVALSDGGGIEYRTCDYRAKATPSVSVSVAGADVSAEAFARSMALRCCRPLDGIGDAAGYDETTSSVTVRSGSCVFSVTVRWHPDPFQAATALARKVAGRLGGES